MPATIAFTAYSGSLMGRIQRWVLVVGPGVLLVVALSLWGLTSKEAWHDEALSVAATRDLARTLRETAGTMASYYLLLAGWIRISDSLWWIRLLSVVHAVGAVVVTGLLVLRQRGAQSARWTCLLLASSWMLVRYGQEARSFALTVLVVAGAWWALDHIVAGGGRRRILVHTAFCILAPATHGLAVIAILAQVVAVALSGAGARVLRRALPGWAGAIGMVGFLYQIGGSEVGAGRPLTRTNAHDLVARLHGGQTVWSPVDLFDTFDVRAILFLVTLAGVAVGLRRARVVLAGVERFRALTPAVWAVGAIGGLMVLSVMRPSMLWRYGIAAVPALAMLQTDAALAGGRVIERGLRRFGSVPALIWRGIPVLPVGVLALLMSAQIPLHASQQDPWTETAGILVEHGRDGDGLLTPQRTARMPLDYAWSQMDVVPELVSLQPSQPLGELRRYDNWRRVPEVMEVVAEVDRIWVVELDRSTQPPEVPAHMDDPAIVDHFEEVDRYEFRGVVLTLLERDVEPAGASRPG